ncbi:MAG: ROK family protein [Chitinophagaceae bacterium]|nr:ROK family protein [Chitinophagaceae bacterium]
MIEGHLKRQIISNLYFKKTLSAVDLSNLLGKSVPHVTKALNELVGLGYLEDKGLAPSSGGRRPQIYSLKGGTMYMVAVAMDQLYTKISITDTLNHHVIPAETHELRLLNNDEALAELVFLINTAIVKSEIDRDKIAGIGIGTPGFINTRLGMNYSYLQPPEEESLLSYLEKELGLPVSLDNDSSITALAELKFGLAQNRSDVMVVNIGWGIGLGMIIDGKLFRGFTGYAGELSHIPISESDTLCDCGKRGCLETEATLRVVTAKVMKEIKEGHQSGLKYDDSPEKMSEAIMIAANKGDQYAIELLSDMGYKIGKAIAILIHIVNPELVVLSGRGATVGKILLAPIQQALNKYCIPRLAEHTEVKVSAMGRKAEIIGAEALIMENFGTNTLSLKKAKAE